jgi:AcrR family transcriptional regulator
MPRPRSCSDADILAAVGAALSERGASGLTLADIGRRVRLSPAALLQRFGSKKKLLLAFAQDAADRAAKPLRDAREQVTSLLWALQQGLRAMSSQPNGIAALRQAPGDDQLAHAVARYTRTVRDEIDTILRDAVQSGELLPCDTRSLAEATHALWIGAVLNARLLDPGQDPVQGAERALSVLLLPYRRPVFMPPTGA